MIDGLRCEVCGSGDAMVFCEGCWTRRPAAGLYGEHTPITVGCKTVLVGAEITNEDLDRVAAAIEKARLPDREGPYGLYNYTQYGYDEPHRVRDFRDLNSATYGDTVFRSNNRRDAEREFEKLTRRHIARAAIEAALSHIPHERKADQ